MNSLIFVQNKYGMYIFFFFILVIKLKLLFDTIKDHSFQKLKY